MKNKVFLLLFGLIGMSVVHAESQSAHGDLQQRLPQDIFELRYESASAMQNKAAKKNNKKRKRQKESITSEKLHAEIACTVQFNQVKDVRKNKVSVGSIGSIRSSDLKSLTATGVDQWLVDLKNAELDGKTALWQGGKHVVVSPSLTKLYAYEENGILIAVFSLTVDIQVGNEISTKKYRGSVARGNLINGYDEYGDALNFAAQEATPRLIDDLKSLCK